MTWFRNGQWVDHDGEPIDLSDADTAGEPQTDETSGKSKRTRSAKKDPRESQSDQ